jgi:thioredoxin-like negative regulator of GroEL
MPPVQTFTAENWDQLVLKSDGPVLVDFRAPWCMSSVLQNQSLNLAAEEWGDSVKVGTLDVSRHQSVALTYHIHVLPALGLFRRGKLLKSYTGAGRMEELKGRWLPSLSGKL